MTTSTENCSTLETLDENLNDKVDEENTKFNTCIESEKCSQNNVSNQVNEVFETQSTTVQKVSQEVFEVN